AAVAGFAVTVVGIAYALVPPGRARRLALAGGGVLLAALGAAQLSGGRDLSGVLAGVIVGVAVPLVLFRLLAPERSFPLSYRRGKSAHLPVEGPRGQAIRAALADQLASAWPGWGRSGPGGRAAPRRCASRWAGSPRPPA